MNILEAHKALLEGKKVVNKELPLFGDGIYLQYDESKPRNLLYVFHDDGNIRKSHRMTTFTLRETFSDKWEIVE